MNAGNLRKISTEITATERCAYLRFTFPTNASSSVLIETSRPGVVGFAHVDAAAQEITGLDRSIYPINRLTEQYLQAGI
jgi:hypothetical protein